MTIADRLETTARLISDSLTPVLNLRDAVGGFFLLLSAIEVFL